jgi:hypothetical protein
MNGPRSDRKLTKAGCTEISSKKSMLSDSKSIIKDRREVIRAS